MIASVLVALQIAASVPALVVRGPDRTVKVPIIASAEGPMLRPESLSEMLPIEVHRDAGTAYTIEVWGARLSLEPGVAVVRVGNDVRQLVAPPRVRSGHLLVPLQLVSEIFPDVVPNTRWDAAKGQLVLFTSRSTGGAVTRGTTISRADSLPIARGAGVAPGAASSDDRLPPVPAKRTSCTCTPPAV